MCSKNCSGRTGSSGPSCCPGFPMWSLPGNAFFTTSLAKSSTPSLPSLPSYTGEKREPRPWAAALRSVTHPAQPAARQAATLLDRSSLEAPLPQVGHVAGYLPCTFRHRARLPSLLQPTLRTSFQDPTPQARWHWKKELANFPARPHTLLLERPGKGVAQFVKQFSKLLASWLFITYLHTKVQRSSKGNLGVWIPLCILLLEKSNLAGAHEKGA